MEEEREESTTTLDDLCPELIDAVLRRVPSISRARLKCVSTTWRHLVATLPPITTSSAGLVVFFKNVGGDPTRHQSSFIRFHHRTHSLSLSKNHNFPWLIDSCNGLILYAKQDETHNWEYCISSPVLNQSKILPHRRKSEILARESLAFDGSHHGNFKVICFFYQEVDVLGGKIGCQIFSSETGDWREIQAPLENSLLLLQNGFQLSDFWGQSVYREGKLYWVWSLCMLVFDEEREYFLLVKLPQSKATRGKREFSTLKLWESEGKIHYCEPTQEGFRVWKYIDQDSWEAKRLIVLDKLKLRGIDIFLWVGEKMKAGIREGLIRPCAFNGDLQLLYFQVGPDTIVSYSFETEKFEEVWAYEKPGVSYFMSFVYPFLFNSLNLVKREIR